MFLEGADGPLVRNLDSPGKALFDTWGRRHSYLRIAVTDRCNLRCVYCVPQNGISFRPKPALLTAEEILRLAKLFVENGISKIRLTGGEPLAREDILSIARSFRRISPSPLLAMTTNGTLLAGMAQHLKEAGITLLNVSLDTLNKDRFQAITGRDQFCSVFRGLEEAIECGFDSLKINVVIMAGSNDCEILDFATMAQEKNLNVRFIEYMPFKDNHWDAESVVSCASIKKQIERRFELTPVTTDPSSPAKDYAISGGGTVSFISAMTNSFCSTCNRLRITADGSFKSCLFYPAELNLRDAMRLGASDSELLELIKSGLAMKPLAAPAPTEIDAMQNRSMIDIGG